MTQKRTVNITKGLQKQQLQEITKFFSATEKVVVESTGIVHQAAPDYAGRIKASHMRALEKQNRDLMAASAKRKTERLSRTPLSESAEKKKRRVHHTDEEMEMVMVKLKEIERVGAAEGVPIPLTAQVEWINQNILEFANRPLDYHSVCRWRLLRTKGSRAEERMAVGRPVSLAFELEVIDEVILTEMNSKKELVVIANVAFSYESFQLAAYRVRSRSEVYQQDKRVNTLKFSMKWVWDLLARWKLRRRRCTTKGKNKPSVEEVSMQSRLLLLLLRTQLRLLRSLLLFLK
ncbi:hypothetical protein B484DRAFT_458577 [Ochromonadaceae sp. CCMP2298]|nr:hypothetical protein B484DRAFT_458577 [Ochromonadaceae sp. CCMP2298]|mmetsp:Transcript_35211/g.75954  ORF Transcript_35211/g.75954 Transcript_35211/m.75954 type:complete len:290 (-) Transcript_35211:435-1304(-)